MRSVVAVLGLCVMLLVGSAPGAVAGDGAAVTPTRLRFDAAVRTSVRGQLVLTAVLTSADGVVIPGRPIDFLLVLDLFGRREAQLGRAETDVAGVAALAYWPTLSGPQVIVVRFRGDERYARAESTSTIDVREAVLPFAEEPLPLAPVRQWMPAGLGLITVLVWGLLLGTLALTAGAIVRAGDRPSATSRRRGGRMPLS